ncbi:hypothetical protein ACFVQ4_10945 [Streptomyces laurentii]|uniref:effector-associated constant component EACC1 n=1 Tax=Streptomyces laurentii TaxID=39478 RepID=UPI00369A9572
MKVTLEVAGPDGSAAGGATLDLRAWLRGDPALRPRIEPAPAAEPEPGAMGALVDLVTVLLQPGGLTVTLAAGVVAWLQTRRGTQTVTITRPDGTQITVASEGVRGLTPEAGGELAQQLARALEAPPRQPPESRASAQGAQADGLDDGPDDAPGNGDRGDSGDSGDSGGNDAPATRAERG